MNELITIVICKKYFRSYGDTIYAEFKENKQYKFIIEKDNVYMYKMNYTYKYIYIFGEHGGYRFHLDKNITKEQQEKIYFPNFYDYFYDKKELRKLKLNEINNRRK